MICKICKKEFKPNMFIEEITGCDIECIRLFSEPESNEDSEEYLTEHWLFKIKD